MPRTPDRGSDQPTVFLSRGTDVRLAGGFTQVPNCVLRSRTLSSGAKVLYGVLLSYAWQDGACHPDQATMAADLGCTDRQVRRGLKELEEEHLVQVHRRGLQQPNLYEIMPIETPDRTKMSGQDRKYMSAPDRNQGSGPCLSKDPGEKDSTVIVKEVADRHTADQAADDDVRPLAEGREGADALAEAVRSLAPRAVPSTLQATAFIQACGGLDSALTSARRAADRHRRTRQSEPINSWQFFLAARENREAPAPPPPVTVPCPACAGRGSLFDPSGDLVSCAACHGSGVRVKTPQRSPGAAVTGPAPPG